MERDKKTIAVVDDEEDILNLVSLHLKRNGFLVKAFTNATDLLNYLKNSQPELIVLDLMLPDADGIELCRSLKHDPHLSSIPIVMLTARGSESDKVLGLELGADDYITKPFSPRELVARIRAVLRRGEQSQESVRRITPSLIMNLKTYEVFLNGKKISLTPTEFKILWALSNRPGWVLSRQQILDYIWGEEKIVVERTVDVHIRHLREKLGTESKIIKNVRGVGYKIET